MTATAPTQSAHAIHEATEIIRTALAELDAAHAAEVTALRAEVRAARLAAFAEVDAACERLSKARDRDDRREGDGDGVLVEWSWWLGSPEWFVDAVPAANRGYGYDTPTAAILAAAAVLDGDA